MSWDTIYEARIPFSPVLVRQPRRTFVDKDGDERDELCSITVRVRVLDPPDEAAKKMMAQVAAVGVRAAEEEMFRILTAPKEPATVRIPRVVPQEHSPSRPVEPA